MNTSHDLEILIVLFMIMDISNFAQRYANSLNPASFFTSFYINKID